MKTSPGMIAARPGALAAAPDSARGPLGVERFPQSLRGPKKHADMFANLTFNIRFARIFSFF